MSCTRTAKSCRDSREVARQLRVVGRELLVAGTNQSVGLLDLVERFQRDDVTGRRVHVPAARDVNAGVQCDVGVRDATRSRTQSKSDEPPVIAGSRLHG